MDQNTRKLTSLLGSLLSVFVLAAQTIPMDTSYSTQRTWEKIVKYYPDAKVIPSKIPAGVKADYDVVYATLKDTPYGNRNLYLDIFRPEKPGRYPVLMMIHGGGWRSGSKEMEHPIAQFVASHGYVTIPVEYRMVLESKYPNAVYDIKAAVRWIKANADKYFIDTTKIAIEGNSAGGQLATLVGMTNGVRLFEGNEGVTTTSSNVHAVVDIDGVVDFMAPRSLNLPTYPDWLGGSFLEKPAVWKEASPAFWVNKSSVPIIFITSSISKYTAGMSEMLDMYDEYGIYSERHQIPDSPHSFWLLHPWFEPTADYIVGFLNKVFNVKK